MGWLSFVAQMAEQMRRGHFQLAYPFRMHKVGSCGEGGDGEEAGGEQTQAGDSPVLPGAALSGLACLWYPGHPCVLTQLRSPSPASLLPLNSLEHQVWVWLKGHLLQAHGQPFVEAAYWGYFRTRPLCPENSILLWAFFPPKLNHSCP